MMSHVSGSVSSTVSNTVSEPQFICTSWGGSNSTTSRSSTKSVPHPKMMKNPPNFGLFRAKRVVAHKNRGIARDCQMPVSSLEWPDPAEMPIEVPDQRLQPLTEISVAFFKDPMQTPCVLKFSGPFCDALLPTPPSHPSPPSKNPPAFRFPALPPTKPASAPFSGESPRGPKEAHHLHWNCMHSNSGAQTVLKVEAVPASQAYHPLQLRQVPKHFPLQTPISHRRC